MRKLLTAQTPPQAVCGPGDRILLRPWDLSHEEYVAHAFDQIRQSVLGQPHVVATVLRVLRMLIGHARSEGREEFVPALRRQIRMLMDAISAQPDLHPDDLERLREISRETAADPAEHDV